MKKIIALLLVLCMIFALCACGGAASQTSEEKPAETVEPPADNAPLMKEPLTLKFCCSESADTSYVIIMNQAFDRITAATNGEIKFESYPSNQLGNIADTLEQMRSGAPMIVSSGFSEIADIASPRFLVTALPYVFEDMSEILTLAHTEWIEDINADVEAAGMEALCYGTQGYRHFISTKPIENAASIKGMIVRMGPSATSQNFVTVMDGTPTTSTWSDNYSLLQTGVIDACEANLELMYNSSLYEVCDYLSLSGHLASPFMCTMNLSIWESIPAEYQEIIKAELDTATYEIYNACVENETKFVEKYKETGIEIIEPDKSSFAACVPDLIEYMDYDMDSYTALREVIESAK